jgi:hypothetical protein
VDSQTQTITTATAERRYITHGGRTPNFLGIVTRVVVV